MKTLEKYKALRAKFNISTDRAAVAISHVCGKHILASKLERFERGGNLRSGQELNAIIRFYGMLEKGILPPHVPEAGKHYRKVAHPPKHKTKKVKALEALLAEHPPKTHIKNGEFYSTPIDGEGISFFPEGQYLLRIESGGVKIFPLAIDNNPMSATLESTQAELLKYKEGYDNWMSLKDLIKD